MDGFYKEQADNRNSRMKDKLKKRAGVFSSNKKSTRSPTKKQEHNFEVTNNYANQFNGENSQEELYINNNADNEINTPAKRPSKNRIGSAGSFSLDKKKHNDYYATGPMFQGQSPTRQPHGLNDGINVNPVGKSGMIFDSMMGPGREDSYMKGMGTQKEIKNNVTSGHGYNSAYIPTGSVKASGQFNLSNYLGTHKKLFAHKHDRNLQIGLANNF